MDVIFQVFVIFVAATIAAELMHRVGLPPIVGELAVGVALGPHALRWIHVNDATSALASLGVVVLMFSVGLELRVSELASVGVAALGASVAGVAVTAASALAILAAFGTATSVALRIAIALSATSAGIGARMLVDYGRVGSRPGRVMLGAAVIDDVVVLLALSLVLTRGTSQSGGSIAVSVVSAVAFIGLVAALGPRVARRFGNALRSERLRRPPFVFAFALCLGLAALSERVGLAALVGAFLAGMVLAETKHELSLAASMHPVYEFLVPFFFVIAGARVDPAAVREVGIGLGIVLIVVTIAAKLFGGALGAFGLDFRGRLFVGAGMVPRGEVTVAAASAMLAARSIDRSLYALLLAAVFVTTIASPLLLRPMIRRT